MEHRKLNSLKVNPLNPRGTILFDDAVVDLAASIRSHGVLQPILITPEGVIVAGHRRVKACEIAGRKEIPCLVRALTEAEQLQIMLIENLQRSDLDPVQEGKAFLELTKRGLNVNQIFQATGITKARINNRIAVAALPEQIHVVFATGKLPVNCVECLADIPPAEQIAWVNKAVAEGWTGSRLTNQIEQALAETRPRYRDASTGDRRADIERWIGSLERVDSQMDKAEGFRAVQITLRQAMTQLTDIQIARAKSKRKEEFKRAS